LTNLDPLVWTISLELVIFLAAVASILFAVKFWKPNRENLLKDIIEEKNKLDFEQIQYEEQMRQQFNQQYQHSDN